MTGVTVSAYGLRFVPECLKVYMGLSWPFFAVILCGMAAYLVFAGKMKTVRAGDEWPVTKVFWLIMICMGLTVCNPFPVRKIVPRFGMTTVYYRVFWVFPLTVGAAYYLTLLWTRQKKRRLGLLLFAICLAGLVFLVPLNPGVENLRSRTALPTNVYKVDGAIPGLCSAVHEDYEKTAEYAASAETLAGADLKSAEGAELFAAALPRCIFPFKLEFAVRQYDAGIALSFDRNMRLYYEGNRSTGLSYKGNRTYRQCALILRGMYGLDDTVTEKQMRRCMKKTGTDYLIVESELANRLLLERSGCELVTQSAGYDIYRFGLTKV